MTWFFVILVMVCVGFSIACIVATQRAESKADTCLDAVRILTGALEKTATELLELKESINGWPEKEKGGNDGTDKSR